MSNLVSVVIPAYNGTDFLAKAIESVLNQTWQHFELIIVDDGPSDSTVETVRRFDDPRVRYIRHEKNRGAVAARFTGVCASSGDILAFLDQDDLFHKEKLQVHVEFFKCNPQVGATYNARFDLWGDTQTVRGLWQPPATVSLPDFVLGFPFAPSDMVLRREWAVLPEIWDDSFATQAEHVIFNGQEIVCCGRLALAGCQFGYVQRALNFRRYHSERVLSHLSARCNSEIACQEMILDDPRCPSQVRDLRGTAFANTYIIFAYNAFVQDESVLARELVEKAIESKPSLLQGNPCELVESFVTIGASDERGDLQDLLQSLFSHLPTRAATLSSQQDWAVARGFLLKGARAVMWGDAGQASTFFHRAAELGAQVDERFLQMVTFQMLGYEAEFGEKAARSVMEALAGGIETVGGKSAARRLKGSYWVNRAFQSYRAGEFDHVPADFIRGVSNDPEYLTNRGLLAISWRSVVERIR